LLLDERSPQSFGERTPIVNSVIAIVGIVGLLIAAGFLIELIVDAGRHRQWIDIPLALAVVAVAIWALVEYGDRLLR